MTGPDVSNYSKTTESKKEVVKGELTNGKLALLGIVSMALSAFGPLSLFAPVPLVMSFLLFGRLKTFYVAAAASALLFALAAIFPGLQNNILIVGVFCVSLLYAFFISQIVEKGKEPVRGLLRAGFIVVSLFVLLFGLFTFSLDVPLGTYVEKQVIEVSEILKSSKEYREAVKAGRQDQLDKWALFSRPKEYASYIMNWSFTAIFVGVFISLWVTLFMTLRNSGIWKQLYKYQYGMKELVNFKTPDFFVWPLIIGLILVVGAEHLVSDPKFLEVVGGNLLFCMAVFYFFQGFGIFVQLLDHLKFVGFFRTMVIICSVFMGWRVIVVVGVFDLWLNFKKYFEKKENEGDNI
jgi:hypothetical protein